MVRSYLTVFALLGLAAVVGCGDDDNGTGGTGGTGGTAGTGGAAGTGGEGGTGGVGGEGGTGGMGGEGGTGGDGGAAFTKDISLGCTNSVTPDISILDWTLDVTPSGDVNGGEPFDAELGGVAFFSESFLDAALAALPGLESVAVTALAATVLPRSGATGDPVVLGLDPAEVEYRCVFEGLCDPANTQENGSNTDCEPVVPGNRCLPYIDLPTSDDCAAGGECETLGKTAQCTANGYCIAGPLPLALEPQTGSYTAEASGEVLFGWDDQNTGATVAGDGTYDLPAALFNDPVEPNGIRVVAGLQVALQCTMAVDSNGPDGVGVPDKASPTPDSALLPVPIDESGTGGAGGEGGTGGSGDPGPDPETKTITVGCTNNVTADTSILPFDLTVDPGPIVGGESVSVEYSGVANFAEAFLDAAQGAVPGGVQQANLVDLRATTQVRAGGTFPNTNLPPAGLTYECLYGGACNPTNDDASLPGNRANTDCVPTGKFNPCGRFVTVPTSDDCSVGGVCDTLGKGSGTSGQCLNGFCVTGDLPLPLDTVASVGTADASGQILFGWSDDPAICPFPAGSLCTLPPAVFVTGTCAAGGDLSCLQTGPLGIRVNASGLSVALECNQAAESGDDAAKQPDSALIAFSIN